MSAGNGHSVGKIVEIKGVVIDAEFEGQLPHIYSALEISVPAADGGSTWVTTAFVRSRWTRPMASPAALR
jgi:F0F1-type ATP synthase beta subunit